MYHNVHVLAGYKSWLEVVMTLSSREDPGQVTFPERALYSCQSGQSLKPCFGVL